MITAVAPGNVTISVGDASADLTVYAGSTLPTGTTVWSNPGDGTGVTNIVPAVPSASGAADVFALQASGIVQAIKSDGTVAWQANAGINSKLIPDFQGGVIVANPNTGTWYKLDGLTGQPYPSSPYGGEALLVHPTGIVFDGLAAIDPTTGQQKFTFAPKEQSISSSNGNCGEYTPSQGSYPATVGQAIIAGDGYLYFPFSWSQSPLASNQKYCYEVTPPWTPGATTETITGHADLHLRLMRVGTDGSTMEITIGDWSADSTTSCINEPGGSGGGGGAECAFGSWFPSYSGAVPGGQLLGNLITNADQGVLYSWSTSFCNQYGNCNYQNQLSTVATGGGASTVATGIGAQYQQPIQPMLQRQDGTYVGTVSGNMVAFNSSGQQIWNQPNYSPQVATSDNGVIATSQSGQAVTFDQNGNQSGQMASLLMQSWTANEYQLGSTESIAVPTIDLAASFSPVLGGNPSSPGTAIEPITQEVRAKIAQVALSKLGSQNWLDQQGHNQCNIFVHDVLKESGTTPPESDLTSWKHRSAYYLGLVDSANYPAQAGDWANPTKVLGCWKTLVVPAQPLPPPLPPDISLPGDVIAEAIQYSDATGHVGIIVGSRQTVSADSAVNCYNPPTPAGTITNSDYGFRPDNYVDPTGCRTHGLEEYAVVKRFVCQ